MEESAQGLGAPGPGLPRLQRPRLSLAGCAGQSQSLSAASCLPPCAQPQVQRAGRRVSVLIWDGGPCPARWVWFSTLTSTVPLSPQPGSSTETPEQTSPHQGQDLDSPEMADGGG